MPLPLTQEDILRLFDTSTQLGICDFCMKFKPVVAFNIEESMACCRECYLIAEEFTNNA